MEKKGNLFQQIDCNHKKVKIITNQKHNSNRRWDCPLHQQEMWILIRMGRIGLFVHCKKKYFSTMQKCELCNFFHLQFLGQCKQEIALKYNKPVEVLPAPLLLRTWMIVTLFVKFLNTNTYWLIVSAWNPHLYFHVYMCRKSVEFVMFSFMMQKIHYWVIV